MTVQFKNGDVVRQVLPDPIEGTVTRFVFDETSGNISYVVENTDTDGHVHSRVFTAEQIALKPA